MHIIALLLTHVLGTMAYAQHHHPLQDVQLHNEFYQNLIRPDVPSARPGSCCGGGDCYATMAHFKGGQWWALRREDKQWIAVPNASVIENEKSPDGRAHLCATIAQLYCFIKPDDGV